MPHECTDCGRRFDDGSKEMLSGCPDCGGNTFQFHPEGADDPPEAEEPPEPPEPAVNSSVAQTVGNAATAVRDLVGGSGRDGPTSRPSGQSGQSSESPVGSQSNSGSDQSGSISARTTTREDAAQSSARSDVVSPDDLPSPDEHQTRQRPAPVMDGQADAGDGQQPDAGVDPERDRPDLAELREQLNEQFESIRVLAPGQYELNLMELYDREEYIIALQEDGKYTIQVPERWKD